MKIVIIILTALFLNVNCAVVKAQLDILNYDPLRLQLSFTEPISLPSFQVMVDNNNLDYTVLDNQTQSAFYLIQVTSNYQLIDIFNSETFSLIFNYPMDIADGRLSVSSYILAPQKIDLYIAMSTWPVYFLILSLLITSLFGIMGIAVIDFIQIYILTELKFTNQTSVVDTYSSMFFFDQKRILTPKQYLMRLFAPTLIIVGFFILGVVSKNVSKLIKSNFIKKRVVKFFAYDLFLTIWTIALPSLMFKSFQFVQDIVHTKITLTNQQFIIGVFFTYLNFINIVAYFYVLYFVMNPKIHQDAQSFREYLKSEEFSLYNKFHRGLFLKSWIKRNTMFFICLRKLIIVMIFFASNNISPYVLALQLIGSFFIFTVRPYKELFYTNCLITLNLLWFFFYILVLEGFFYFNISKILETRNSLSKYLLSKSILFHIICFLGLVISVFEAYRLFKNLKYQFKQEAEVKKQKPIVLTTRGRLYTETSDKMARQMKQSLIFDSPTSPDQRHKKREPSNSSGKGKINLFEIQMQDFSSPETKNRKLTSRIKKRWKDKSLLEQLATN